MVGQSRTVHLQTSCCSPTCVCVHVWPRHNLHPRLKGGRYIYAHWPRERNTVRCACERSEMSLTTEIQQKIERGRKITEHTSISKTSRQPAACHQLQLIWLKKNKKKTSYLTIKKRQKRKQEMKMNRCTSWIGGACFSPAGRNWRERSRRNQTWYRCTNMAVIQRSIAIKHQRRKNSWLNERVSSLIASTRWFSYSFCCCRQPVTLLELSWDAGMCFFSLLYTHPPLFLAL